MRDLQVLLLTDGKPGHANLAEGIVAAIARRRPVVVTRIGVVRPWWMPPRALAHLTAWQGNPRALLRRIYRAEPDRWPVPDLVVSAGGDTLAANVAAARAFGVPNIFYGSLRRFLAKDFALVLTSYAANVHGPNEAMTLKPGAFDPALLPPVRPLSVAAGASAAAAIGVLIGGDSGTVRYGERDWDDLMRLLAGLTSAGFVLTVSNSRRTPAAVSDRLAAWAAEVPLSSRFIDVRLGGSGALVDLFAASSAVIVTSDSSSMVSEAIWARRPVLALAPRAAELPPLERVYRDYLAAGGWVVERGLAGLAVCDAVGALASLKPLDANPLDALAHLIGDRVPQLFDGAGAGV